MSDDPATNDAPKTETPAVADAHAHKSTRTASSPEPEGIPEAEASVESVTTPDPEHAPEPAPVAPPEIAEVEAATGESNVVSSLAESETQAPISETVSEELEPIEEYEDESVADQHAADSVTSEASEIEPASASEDEAADATAPPKRTRKKSANSAQSTHEATEEAVSVPSGEETGEPAPENKKKWYAIKVQSGREESIKGAILRKVAIEGLEEYLGRIEIPVEEVVEKKQVRVKDKKTGEYTYQEKKVTKKKKKFHGYIFAELEFNDRILYLFRETSGVGDFLNMRGKPPVPEPMPEHEVQSMLTGVVSKQGPKDRKVKVKIDFEKGDRVRIRDGSFANQEGEVKSITEPKDPTDTPKITVELTFWGRPLDVELDYWQVDKV